MKIITFIGRVAFFCYIFYLTFVKPDPTMRDIMFVSGITCLEVILSSWAKEKFQK